MTNPQVGSDFGRYHLVRQLGRGGMGIVFEAVDKSLGRPVALKIILPDLSDVEDYRTRFSLEASALARIRSRHIVGIHEYGEQDGSVYIVTELFPDGDLADWLNNNGPPSPQEALSLTAQIVEGLQDAHDAGVVHRDIKPSNVLLWDRGHGLIPYLCDFGIAGGDDGGLTRSGTVIGSLNYMAPERHMGHPADEIGDVYSAGCLLWAIITGTPPYSGTDFQLMEAHLRDPIPQLEVTDPLTERVNDILQTVLAKDPSQRFQTAHAFRAALLDVLQDTNAQPPRAPLDRPVAEVMAGHELPGLAADRYASEAPSSEQPDGAGADSAPDHGSIPVEPTRPPKRTPAEAATAGAATPSPSRTDRAAATGKSDRPWLLIGAGLVSLVAVIGLIFVLTSGGSDNDPAPSLSKPTVEATSGYRKVDFSAQANGAGARVEIKTPDGKWKQATSAAVPVNQGGAKACVEARVVKDGKRGTPVRKCGTATTRTVTLTAVSGVKYRGCNPSCTAYNLEVAGFGTNTSPVAKLTTNGKPWCEPGASNCPEVRVKVDKSGRGVVINQFLTPKPLTGSLRADVDGVTITKKF